MKWSIHIHANPISGVFQIMQHSCMPSSQPPTLPLRCVPAEPCPYTSRSCAPFPHSSSPTPGLKFSPPLNLSLLRIRYPWLLKHWRVTILSLLSPIEPAWSRLGPGAATVSPLLVVCIQPVVDRGSNLMGHETYKRGLIRCGDILALFIGFLLTRGEFTPF